MTSPSHDIAARIASALAALPADALASMRPAATAEQITEAETVLGVSLPEAVRTAYLQHDGQRAEADGLFDGDFRWLSLKGTVRDWQTWDRMLESGDLDEMNMGEAGTSVRMDWWNRRWIPVARSPSGDCLCVELAPGEKGVSGQIIEVWHDDDSRSQAAIGFVELLEAQA